ncbi:MAG TPA: CHAT domain-containing protein, partial [Elainellaceae cyanobacterium]
MQILHFELQPPGETSVELRYFTDNRNQYESRRLLLQEIADLIEQAQADYYVRARVQADHATVGQKLFNWIDGSDRWLLTLMRPYLNRGEGIILAMSAKGTLGHLPWELLHDGNSFLMQRLPAVVPIRWVGDGQALTPLTKQEQPENRALQVLFMATSPRDIKPVLDFEREEAQILTATARQPLALVVEESGSLEELGYRVEDYGKGYFDVLHLTGHATIQADQTRFITETHTGDADYSSATDIARELQFQMPKLVFLSGCRTGQAADAGAVPSMAEELLQQGASVVLGWGQTVLDTDATAAAAALYQGLSSGKALTEAIALTYQALIEQEARDWHLLRLYAKSTLPGALVTPPRRRGRQFAPPASVSTQFLDPDTQQVKVANRESFVGRRRQLQNCLRALIEAPNQEIGVLIHGMGGLGKSSLAARICDRLPAYERVVWVGLIDEDSLVKKLAEKLDDQALRANLERNDEELKYRLRSLFRATPSTSFLLVLDDFEVNLEARNQSYVPTEAASTVLNALVWAIQESPPHGLILTSRYDFDSTALRAFYKQPLDALHGADLQKKCSRLSAFQPPDRPETEAERATQTLQLQEQAKQLADGNPRLLETLHDQVLEQADQDAAATLATLQNDPTKLRQTVLEDRVLRQIDAPLRQMLSRGLVFELPVPRDIFETVILSSPLETNLIDRVIALGLLEATPDNAVRVPRILPLTVPVDAESLYQQAAQELYHYWWEEENLTSEEQALELVRLGLLAHDQEIAASVGDRIATGWVNSSRYHAAMQLCRQILAVFADYRILGTVARAEEILGFVEDALAHYQQALERCPEDDLLKASANLNNMANRLAAQGEIEQAMQLWQQSLEIQERIGDV